MRRFYDVTDAFLSSLWRRTIFSLFPVWRHLSAILDFRQNKLKKKKSGIWFYFFRTTKHFRSSHRIVLFFLLKSVKIQNEHICLKALELLSRNLMFIFACDKPLLVYPLFVFTQKIYIIGSKMTECIFGLFVI